MGLMVLNRAVAASPSPIHLSLTDLCGMVSHMVTMCGSVYYVICLIRKQAHGGCP